MGNKIQVTDEEIERVRRQLTYVLDCVDREMVASLRDQNLSPPTAEYWIIAEFLVQHHHQQFCQMYWNGHLNATFADDDVMASQCAAAVRKFLFLQNFVCEETDHPIYITVGNKK